MLERTTKSERPGMIYKLVAVVLALALAVVVGGRMVARFGETAARPAENVAWDRGSAGSNSTAAVAPSQQRTASQARYVAVRHRIRIVVSEADLQKRWDSAIALCSALRCEVLASSLTAEVDRSAPSGAMTLRIAPDDYPKLFKRLVELGTIVNHSTESEDKTDAVIDVEAKLRNLTAYRDSLRGLLNRPSAEVNDLIAVRRELSSVQADLESELTKRKVLANETEKVAVEISFVSTGSVRGPGFFGQVGSALRESGEVLAASITALITFIVAVLPWLVVILAVAWVVRILFNAMRRRRTAPNPLPSN